MAHPRRKRTGAAAFVGIAALALTACGGGGDGDTDSAEGASGEEFDCAAFEQYGDLEGTTVTVFASIVTGVMSKDGGVGAVVTRFFQKNQRCTKTISRLARRRIGPLAGGLGPRL